jgi:hypothetical protein
MGNNINKYKRFAIYVMTLCNLQMFNYWKSALLVCDFFKHFFINTHPAIQRLILFPPEAP